MIKIRRWWLMDSINQIGRPPNSSQRARIVTQPSRHDGLGNALRQAYDPGATVLPDELKALLARLGSTL